MIGWIIGIVYSIACIALFIYSVIEFNESGEDEPIMGIVLSVVGLGLYVAIFSSSCSRIFSIRNLIVDQYCPIPSWISWAIRFLSLSSAMRRRKLTF